MLVAGEGLVVAVRILDGDEPVPGVVDVAVQPVVGQVAVLVVAERDLGVMDVQRDRRVIVGVRSRP